jgi:hypothetical protein
MRIVMNWLGLLRRIGRKAGPYLMLEMLLPGGTLVALMLLLWQRRKPGIKAGAHRVALVVTRVLAGVFEQRILVTAPIAIAAKVSKSGPIRYSQCPTTIRSEP